MSGSYHTFSVAGRLRNFEVCAESPIRKIQAGEDKKNNLYNCHIGSWYRRCLGWGGFAEQIF